MAVVIETFAMEPTYLPFERPSDVETLWSSIPRGLRGFTTSEVLPLKLINDVQVFELNATLPTGFAYVFAEIGVRLAQNRAFDWDGQYSLNLRNWYQGTTAGKIEMNWKLDFPSFDRNLSQRVNGFTALDTLPKQPMWSPRGTTGIRLVISSFNSNSNAAVAGTIAAFINFWEFDLEQIRKFPINSPFPTHSR